jgi:hypothetical protein
MRPSLRLNITACFGHRAGMTIGMIGGRQHIETIRDRADSCAQRNFFSFQSMRIACAVIAFMVRQDNGRHLG